LFPFLRTRSALVTGTNLNASCAPDPCELARCPKQNVHPTLPPLPPPSLPSSPRSLARSLDLSLALSDFGVGFSMSSILKRSNKLRVARERLVRPHPHVTISSGPCSLVSHILLSGCATRVSPGSAQISLVSALPHPPSLPPSLPPSPSLSLALTLPPSLPIPPTPALSLPPFLPPSAWAPVEQDELVGLMDFAGVDVDEFLSVIAAEANMSPTPNKSKFFISLFCSDADFGRFCGRPGAPSSCVMGRLVHTGLGSSSLVAHVPQYPPPPHAHSFVFFCGPRL
jgi:hypothetical protein